MPSLAKHVPTLGPDSTYYEPFLGGGALFFHLQPGNAVLSDVNAELIECFCAVRDDVEGVIAALRRLRRGEDAYYRVRASRPRTDVTRAARFIYLSKMCFNGLYRVSKAGSFNTPYGRPSEKLRLCDAKQLREASIALQRARLRVCEFPDAVSSARAGDLVYFDPPYTTAHTNNGFIEYNAHVFSWEHQAALADLAEALVERGVHVLVSNASHSSIRDLYSASNTLRVWEIPRHSTIAASPAKRYPTTELVFVGTPTKASEE